VKRADGSYAWCVSRGVPVFDLEGRVVRWFGTATDIDAIKRAEQELAEQHRLKDEFLATLSHELRTPINAVLGWTRMLRLQQVPPERRDEALATVERNAAVQARLIEDLLDVSRLGKGHVHLRRESVNLVELIARASDTLRHTAEQRQVRFELAVAAGGLMVSGDPDRLQQVVWNLVANAIKFSVEGQAVRVEVARRPGWADIVVSDEGEGIDPAFLPYVFEPFRQADGSTTRSASGMGLGLAVARHLAELHGGKVEARSEGRGRGATFTLSLPLEEGTASVGQHQRA
jgi:signal transduction histidine kinase